MTTVYALERPSPLQLSDDKAVELAEMFRILGDPTRLKIVVACLSTPAPVGAVAEAIGISPSLASHHLRLLRAARIVRAERQGRQVFYRAADQHVRTVITDMVAHVGEAFDDHE